MCEITIHSIQLVTQEFAESDAPNRACVTGVVGHEHLRAALLSMSVWRLVKCLREEARVLVCS